MERIKSYIDKIKKFRKLDCFKDLEPKEFHNKIRGIFPKFCEEKPILVRNVIYNKDLKMLDLMFKKMEDIKVEFERRQKEINIIDPIIRDLEIFVKDNKKVSKERMYRFIRKYNFNKDMNANSFIKKYPRIIERLVDPECKSFKTKDLLYEQIKYTHEIYIGEILKKQYLDPVVKNL